MTILNAAQSKEDLIADAKARIQFAISTLFARKVATQEECWRLVWDPTGYTTEELLAAFGTQGRELFRLSALNAINIMQANPRGIAPRYLVAPRSYTIAPNGTVTLTQEAPPNG